MMWRKLLCAKLKNSCLSPSPSLSSRGADSKTKKTKSTTSSDARSSSSLKVPSSSSSSSSSSSGKKAATRVKTRGKETCSSTLKQSKFPEILPLNPEGTSEIKICSYTYCSLNTHDHRHRLPPLKVFLSARRRAIKKRKMRPPPAGDTTNTPLITLEEEEQEREQEEKNDNDFFLEIYTAGNDQREAEDQEVLMINNEGINYKEILNDPSSSSSVASH